MRCTAKLIPFASRTIELTDFVPLPQGNTHSRDGCGWKQDEPGPRVGSYPASVARFWNIVKVETLEHRVSTVDACQGTMIDLQIGTP